jgi:hypothetical protein
VKVTVIRHVITGDLINIQIGTPLKIVAMAANPMEIARMTIVQVTMEILNIPIHVHNIKAGINTKGPNDANLIATRDRLAVSTVIKGKLVIMIATVDSLVVMIVISGHLVTRLDPIHIIHAGRVVRKGNTTIIQISLVNIRDMLQNKSYSKATTSSLTKATLLNLTQPVLRREKEKLPKPKPGKVDPNRVQLALNHHNAATSGQRQKHNHSKVFAMHIRTVLGDIAPEELGITLGHEHLLIDLRGLWNNPSLTMK